MADMLTGVEVITPQFGDYERDRAIRSGARLFKVRKPELVPAILAAVPDAHLLCRNPGEGEDLGDVRNGYHQWLPTLRRYADRIIAYQVANEPNNNPRVDPNHWTRTVGPWLESLDCPVPLCSPGLTRYARRREWEAALHPLPWDYIGKHLYWQQDGPLAAIEDVLSDVDNPSRVIVSEINAGHASPDYHPDVVTRASEVMTAARELAQRGVSAMVLFALTHWQDWGFTYSPSLMAEILRAGHVSEPVPQETTMYCLDISNYTGYLNPGHIVQLKQAGVGLVIVRLPIPGVERQELQPIALQQIEVLSKAGIPWQGYMWCYPDIPVERQVPVVLDFLAPIEHTYHGDILWVDVETDEPSFRADVMAWLRAARPLIEARGYAMGIYTSATMWAKVKGTDEFADCPLWDANYNGTPGQGLISYGGWGGKPIIHQYSGTTTVAGLTVDQNVVLAPEWLTWRTPEAPAQPEPEPEPELPAWLPHLDAAWGALERARAEIEYAHGELLNLKRAAELA